MNGDDRVDDEDVVEVLTVPWPTLSDRALEGVAGEIVGLVAEHTEADPSAILLQLLAAFGAMVGHGPHVRAGNADHHAVIHPLVVGRTSDGAKGTSFSVVASMVLEAEPEFAQHITSGLSTAEGLIEAVRDGTPASEATPENFDPGVEDKRLLVIETEYRQVLSRSRRDGNTLAPTLRQGWDGGTLRTMTRTRSRLMATDPHIIIIGHITPGEFRAELRESDLSGGSINRLQLCLSRRSKLQPRLGNVPPEVVTKAAKKLRGAVESARTRDLMEFDSEVWPRWVEVYRMLNRDRPESRATDATARAVPQVLRLALIYALLDGADAIELKHLNAAVALWGYCEDSARWLFSTYELDATETAHGKLVEYIKGGGGKGRTRTEISTEHFAKNRTAEQISNVLAPLIHAGVVMEMKVDGLNGGRPSTRYVHSSLRIRRINENSRSTA